MIPQLQAELVTGPLEHPRLGKSLIVRFQVIPELGGDRRPHLTELCEC